MSHSKSQMKRLAVQRGSDTPRTDALQDELASMPGPECLYTEEMADRMWFLLREFEGKLTYLYANCIGDSMALGIMQLQRRELADARAELAEKSEECERLREDAERYRWLRGFLRHAKWADHLESLRPEESKYIADDSLDAAIDAARNG